MIAFLARIFGLQTWMIELILGVILGTAAYGMFKHIEHVGAIREKAKIAAQVAADEKETAKRVAAAEHTHDSEIADLTAYRVAHPDTVRLCVSPGVRTPSTSPRLPGAAAGGVQQVPAGNSSGGEGTAGPNIFGLLDALAARADEVSAQLRARQSIEQ